MTWEAPGTFLLPSTLPKFTFSCSLWGVGFFLKAGEWPKASGEGTKPSLHGWLRVDINFPGPPSSSQASALKIPGRAWRRSSDSRLLFFALTSEATTTLYGPSVAKGRSARSEDHRISTRRATSLYPELVYVQSSFLFFRLQAGLLTRGLFLFSNPRLRVTK